MRCAVVSDGLAAPLMGAATGDRCWCGAARWQEQFRTPRFGLVRCARCESFRLDPPPLADASVARFYTAFYAGGTDAAAAAVGATGRFWRVAREVPALAAPGAAALDVGCGEGRLCGELLDAGWATVTGVDLSESRLARARAAYPRARFLDSLDAIDLQAASFDLVVLDNVLEHLHEPLAMLARLAGALRPDGRLVLVTPNMDSGHYRLLGRRWTPELCPDQHVFLFTHPALARILHRAGLVVERAGTLQTPAHPWRAWRAHVRRRDGREIVWRAAQECGTLWSRVIGAGGMLYAVARRAAAGAEDGA